MEAEGSMSLAVRLYNDCVFESRKIVMKKNKKSLLVGIVMANILSENTVERKNKSNQ